MQGPNLHVLMFLFFDGKLSQAFASFPSRTSGLMLRVDSAETSQI